MPFAVDVLGVFIELRAWRTLVGRSYSLDRLAIHVLLSADTESAATREP